MTAATSAPHVHVHTQGIVSAADVDHARDKVLAALCRSRPGAVRPRQAHRVTGSRGGPGRPRSGELSQLDPEPDRVTPGAEFVTVSTARPTMLRVEEAIDRLNVTGWPFVFFQDAATERGCVVYHRYDGHYGRISPAA